MNPYRLSVTEAQAAEVFKAGKRIYRTKAGSVYLELGMPHTRSARWTCWIWEDVRDAGYLADHELGFYVELT